MENHCNPESIPWSTPDGWDEACFSINHLLRLHIFRLNKALTLAKTLKIKMFSIFPLLDELCQKSCPWCPDPCCLKANVWFDFTDLLFLYLNNEPVPSCQLKTCSDDTCRYSGPEGCTLPRITRPWICTWYLCPTQTAILRKDRHFNPEFFNKTVQDIKTFRRKMETEFIKVITDNFEQVQYDKP